MHGGAAGSGAPPGERNGNFKTGRYTKQTRELGKLLRKMARDGETLLVTTLHRYGLKPPAVLRRRRHVRKAMAAAKGEKTR